MVPASSHASGAVTGNLRRPQLCPDRQVKSATMIIRRAAQQFVWQHGCADAKPCGRKYGAHCLQRHSGGVATTDVKSRAGRRTVGMPAPLVHEIERHRERQALGRAHAANLWREEGWVFTSRLGGPVHPTVDHESWKALLRKAQVRDARLHDARHTAATMLLDLKVPLPAVMEIMGWSDASMAKRYMHVPNEFLAAIADQVGELVWRDADDGMTGHQRVLRQLNCSGWAPADPCRGHPVTYYV